MKLSTTRKIADSYDGEYVGKNPVDFGWKVDQWLQSHPQKTFVSSDNRVPFICPECYFSKEFPVSQFHRHHHFLSIQCKCKHLFRVQVEHRRSIRKNTGIGSFCVMDSTDTDRWNVTIVNLSLRGVCLEFNISHAFIIGEKGIVEFTLNDSKKTVINREIIVKSTSTKRIMCQFHGEYAYQKVLGFYLSS